jgi:hypothetical protein
MRALIEESENLFHLIERELPTLHRRRRAQTLATTDKRSHMPSRPSSQSRAVFVDSPPRIFPSLGQIDAEIAHEFVGVFGVAEFGEGLLVAATLIQPVAEHRHQMVHF